MKFLDKFQRITSGGKFLAEIDGLRFLAIIIVLLYHTRGTVLQSGYGLVDSPDDWHFISELMRNGWQGVELFFVISGFILGLPFAKQFILHEKKVNLKQYFWRRITRLEPPYIISLTLFFIVLIIHGDHTFHEYFPSYCSSLVYLNGMIFNNPNFFITTVIWSLEIEVQFYLLAPLLSFVFLLPKFPRRLIISLLIMVIPYLRQYIFISRPTIYNFLEYFLIGFILADLYLDKKIIIPKFISITGGIILLLILLYVDHNQSLYTSLIYSASIFIFYYLVLTDRFWKKRFSNQWITTIGGMCYSIYMIHSPLFSLIIKYSHYYKISDYYLPNIFINIVICTISSLVISAIFFKLIEQPCMDKNWTKKFILKFIFFNKFIINIYQSISSKRN